MLSFSRFIYRFFLKKPPLNNRMLPVEIDLTFPVQKWPCVTTEDFN